MKQILRVAFCAITILSSEKTVSQTNVSDWIVTNTTWTVAGSPYIVTTSVGAAGGVTLTVQPGVTVKFFPATELIVQGTPRKRRLSLSAAGWRFRRDKEVVTPQVSLCGRIPSTKFYPR